MVDVLYTLVYKNRTLKPAGEEGGGIMMVGMNLIKVHGTMEMSQ
jgi:hypothetical protein